MPPRYPTMEAFAADVISTSYRDHIRRSEAAAHLIACANRLEAGSITVPSELYDAIESTPGSRVYSAEAGTVAEIRVGRVSISAVRLALGEAA